MWRITRFSDLAKVVNMVDGGVGILTGVIVLKAWEDTYTGIEITKAEDKKAK